MEKWSVAVCEPEKNDGASLFLMNRSKTLVSVHKRLKFDPLILFKKLERIKFPFKYTDKLERIYFTVLTGNAAGWYENDEIWIDVSQNQIDCVAEVFVHEVGHHIEEHESVASFLHEERMKKSKRFSNEFSEKSDDEYMALGFERYYDEDKSYRRALRKKNPLLYKTIQLLHRDYSQKG